MLQALPLFLLAFGAPQQVALEEDFNDAVFPPAGWTTEAAPGGVGWQHTTFARGIAFHQRQILAPTEDSRLITPALDLSDFPVAFLHFWCSTDNAQFLANHPNSVGDGYSVVEVSTDGGLTWSAPLWEDTATYLGGWTDHPTVDLSAYVGLSDVRIAFHYYGTEAHSWDLDEVVVDTLPVETLHTAVDPVTGHSYRLLARGSYSEALAKAELLGGHLASVDSVAENQWITDEFLYFDGSYRRIMLGLNDVQAEGTFVWQDGTPLVHGNWRVGHPNTTPGNTEDHVFLATDGEWYNYDAEYDHLGYALVEYTQASMSVTPLIAGQHATIEVQGMEQGSEVAFVFSTQGNGPFQSPFGTMEVDPDLITPLFSAPLGDFEMTTLLPAGLSGATLYGQAVHFRPHGATTLTNPIAAPIQ